MFAALSFVAEFYFGNNKIGLIIHLKNCNYPSKIENVSIGNRQKFNEFLFGQEARSSGEFTIEKSLLIGWLKNSNFEVISHIPNGTNERKFYIDLSKVPKEILEGQKSFHFQVLHSNNERTVIKVTPSTKQLLIQLEYCTT